MAMANDFIGIAPGIRIQVSKDGRATHAGCPDSEVLDRATSWLAANPEHPNRERVKLWSQQKRKQLEQDKKEQQAKLQREEVDARILKNIKPGDILWGGRDIIRKELRRQ